MHGGRRSATGTSRLSSRSTISRLSCCASVRKLLQDAGRYQACLRGIVERFGFQLQLSSARSRGRAGKSNEAELLHWEALAASREIYGNLHLQTIVLLANMGANQIRVGAQIDSAPPGLAAAPRCRVGDKPRCYHPAGYHQLCMHTNIAAWGKRPILLRVCSSHACRARPQASTRRRKRCSVKRLRDSTR